MPSSIYLVSLVTVGSNVLGANIETLRAQLLLPTAYRLRARMWTPMAQNTEKLPLINAVENTYFNSCERSGCYTGYRRWHSKRLFSIHCVRELQHNLTKGRLPAMYLVHSHNRRKNWDTHPYVSPESSHCSHTFLAIQSDTAGFWFWPLDFFI
jgi:hypothetical protein